MSQTYFGHTDTPGYWYSDSRQVNVQVKLCCVCKHAVTNSERPVSFDYQLELNRRNKSQQHSLPTNLSRGAISGRCFGLMIEDFTARLTQTPAVHRDGPITLDSTSEVSFLQLRGKSKGILHIKGVYRSRRVLLHMRESCSLALLFYFVDQLPNVVSLNSAMVGAEKYKHATEVNGRVELLHAASLTQACWLSDMYRQLFSNHKGNMR